MRITHLARKWGPVFGLAQRYIFRTVFLSFLGALLILTAIIWVNQALRELNLVTANNQSMAVFLTVSGLSIPIVAAVIAPVAMFIAMLFSLNKFGGDSELISMSAAGLSRRQMLSPILISAVVVALFVATLTLWIIPAAAKSLRDIVTRVRADVVANFVREGQFLTFDRNVTFHFRERSGDSLQGIFIHDARDEREAIVYTAEKGRTLQAEGRSYLVLDKGTAQRLRPGSAGGVVTFERYAIDLSQLSGDIAAIAYRPRERGTADLLTADPRDPTVAAEASRISAELHDRFSAPLYPFAFALIAFAALGAPRTTRQGRGKAIGLAILAVFAVRTAGFAVTTRIARSPDLAPLAYVVPVLGALIAAFVVWRGAELGRLLAPRPPRRPAGAGA
jgi:lipopolysaccharide export system permease protein